MKEIKVSCPFVETDKATFDMSCKYEPSREGSGIDVDCTFEYPQSISRSIAMPSPAFRPKFYHGDLGGITLNGYDVSPQIESSRLATQIKKQMCNILHNYNHKVFREIK